MFLQTFCIVPQAALEYPKSSCSSVYLFLSIQGPGWLLPVLCLQFPGGPTIKNWRLLVLGIVSVTPVYHLCLCVLSFIISPFIFDLPLHWKGPWLDDLNNADALTFHVPLQSGVSLAMQLVPMYSPCNCKGQLPILKTSKKQDIENTKGSIPSSQLSWKGSRIFIKLKEGQVSLWHKKPQEFSKDGFLMNQELTGKA